MIWIVVHIQGSADRSYQIFRTGDPCAKNLALRDEHVNANHLAEQDCAALPPILEEAGGTFTDWQGDRTIWAEEGISTNGALFDDLMHLINE
jgi:hypothetical protein